MNQEPEIYRPSPNEGALRQGEILANVIELRVTIDSLKAGGSPDLSRIIHPYAMVVSQDCDLAQDFIEREKDQKKVSRLIPSILFCQVIDAATLKSTVDGRTWDRVKINKDERFHFLQTIRPDQDKEHQGLPELGIDFKRYFSIPTEEVYFRLQSEIKRRCVFFSPYLEHLSTRFYYFQSRVALPLDHVSE